MRGFQLGRRRLAAPCGVALVLAACVGLAACGGSSKTTASSSGSTVSSKSSAAASGSAVRIGLIASGTGVTAEPWVEQGAQVGVNAVNAAGGLMGHKIQLDYCDDQGSVQTAAVCAQKLLVADKDLMLVGDDGLYDTGVIPVVNTEHTIMFSPDGSTTAVWSSPNVFILGTQIVEYSVVPQFLPPGKHNVAEFAADVPGAIKSAQTEAGLFKAKGNAFKIVTVPLTASDFSTPCLQAKNFHADVGLADFNTLTQFAAMAQACKQLGVNLTWVVDDPEIAPPVIQAISKLNLKSIIVTSYSPTAYSAFFADMAKYGPADSSPYTESSMDPYVGFKLLPEIVSGAGSLNVAKIKAWLETQTAFNTDGFTSPLNLTAANHPLAPYNAIKNTCAYHYTVQGTKLVPASPVGPFCYKAPAAK